MDDWAKQEALVTAIPVYEEKFDIENLTRERQATITRGAKKTKKNWWTQVAFNERQEEYNPACSQKSSKYAFLWDGHLGRNCLDTQHIELNISDTRPIHSALYHAGTRKRLPERVHIDKMLNEVVAEPANTDWGSSVKLAPKNDGTPDVASITDHWMPLRLGKATLSHVWTSTSTGLIRLHSFLSYTPIYGMSKSR